MRSNSLTILTVVSTMRRSIASFCSSVSFRATSRFFGSCPVSGCSSPMMFISESSLAMSTRTVADVDRSDISSSSRAGCGRSDLIFASGTAASTAFSPNAVPYRSRKPMPVPAGSTDGRVDITSPDSFSFAVIARSF